MENDLLSDGVNIVADLLTPANIKLEGFPREMFVDLDDEACSEAECNICYMVAKQPRKCSNNHRFCHTCIVTWTLSTPFGSSRCPTCRVSAFDVTGFYEADVKLDKRLQETRVKCMVDENCDFEGTLKHFLMHPHGISNYYNSPTKVEKLRINYQIKTLKQKLMKIMLYFYLYRCFNTESSYSHFIYIRAINDMGLLLENLPNSYTITHMNTPHSFGEEILGLDIDMSVGDQQDEVDDGFDENTLSMVMGILGDPVRRAELERHPIELSSSQDNLPPLVWSNEDVHIAEDMTLPAAEYMTSLDEGQAGHIANEARRTFWCEPAPTSPAGMGRGSRGVPFVVYMRLALLVPRDGSRLVTHRRSGRSVFVTRGLGAPRQPITTVGDMETEVEALGGNILGLGRRRRSGDADWSADERRLRYSDDYGTTATPEDYARFEFIFTASRYDRSETPTDYANIAAELSRSLPRNLHSNSSEDNDPDDTDTPTDTTTDTSPDTPPVNHLPGQPDYYAALSNAREAPTYVEGGVELIASGGGGDDPSWDYALSNRLAHHRLLRQHSDSMPSFEDDDEIEDVPTTSDVHQFSSDADSSPVSIDSTPVGRVTRSHQIAPTADPIDVDDNVPEITSSSDGLNATLCAINSTTRNQSSSSTTTPLSLITNTPLTSTPVYLSTTGARRPPTLLNRSTAFSSQPTSSNPQRSPSIHSTNGSSSQSSSSHGRGRRGGGGGASGSVGAANSDPQSASTSANTRSSTPADDVPAYNTSATSSRRNSSKPLLSLRRSSARLSLTPNSTSTLATTTTTTTTTSTLSPSTNIPGASDAQRNSEVVISQFPAIPGTDN